MSSAVAQNWSMHVKYASRHELYPDPNVFDAVAARDSFVDWVAVRAVFTRCWDVAERDTTLFRCAVVRAFWFCVFVRGVIVRWVVAWRCVAWCESVAIFRDDIDAASRPTEFVERTAAPAMPMHIKQTARKGSILLILTFILDVSKKA